MTFEDIRPPIAIYQPHTIHLDANGDGSFTSNDNDGRSSEAFERMEEKHEVLEDKEARERIRRFILQLINYVESIQNKKD